MADDLSVSRVSEAPRDGGKPKSGPRAKRRPPAPQSSAKPPATEAATHDTSGERRIDLLV